MKKVTSHILLCCLLLLLLGSCSADEHADVAPLPPLPPEETHAVQFRTTVGGKNTSGAYEEEYFKVGDEIRICCPVSHATPDFSTGSPSMYVYKYDQTETETTDWSQWPYHFVPKETDGGFDWRFLQPSSIYYVFEALHFPAREPFTNNRVPAEQDTPSTYNETDGSFSEARGLDAADMLIAHHRQTLLNARLTVPLTFYHAFAMVEVTVELPVHWSAKEGAFPPNALKKVYMNDMLLEYEVNYSATISSDGLRKVRVPTDPKNPGKDWEKEREDVTMRLISCKPEITDATPIPDDEESKEDLIQTYIFRGIVPEQNFINSGHDFIFFEVQKYNSQAPVLYRFTVRDEQHQLTLESSKILSLHLCVDENTNPNNVVAVTADVKPWLDTVMDGDMELVPETENTPQ